MPYEITYQEISPNIGNPITIISSVPSVDINAVNDGSTYKISVVAINNLGVRSPATHLEYTVIGKTLPPADVVNFAATLTKFGVYLSWNENTEIDLLEYEVRKGTSWDSAINNIVFKGSTATSFTDVNPSLGDNIYWVAALDTTGHYSNTPVGVIASASISTLAITSTITGTDYKLIWSEPSSTYAIDYYEIRTGASWDAGTVVGTTKSTIFQNPVIDVGDKTFYVAAIDIAGNVSTPTTVNITINDPGMPTVSIQIVDNNVLFYWTDVKTTLPISYYEIRKGTAFGTASVVGTKSGLFTSLFETVGGLYTYWVVGVDTAGNYGTEKGTIVTVNKPPDYILTSDLYSDFSGTKSNAALDLEDLSLPHNITETWTDHFTVIHVSAISVNAGGSGYIIGDTFRLNTGTASIDATGQVTTVSSGTVTGVVLALIGNYTVAPTASGGATVTLTGTGTGLTINATSGAWSTPNAQVAAGFPVYGQPALTTGYYEEVFDYGTLLPANNVTVLLDDIGSIGSPIVSVTISSSTNDVDYIDYTDTYTAFLSNFRYIKIRITATSTGTDILNLVSINVKLDSKIINDAGSRYSVLATDDNQFTYPEDLSNAYWTKYNLGLFTNTNKWTFEDDLTDASWTKGNMLAFGSGSISDAILGADNTSLTADLLIENTTASVEHYVTRSSVTSVIGKIYTLVQYVKAYTTDRSVRLAASATMFGVLQRADYDPNTGIVSNVTGGCTAYMTDAGNGWYRCVLVTIAATAAAASYFASYLVSSGTTTYTGNGASGLYFWRFQLYEDAASISNALLAPDGTMTANLIIENTTASVQRLFNRSINTEIGVRYTISHFIKPYSEDRNIYLWLNSTGFGAQQAVGFNLTTNAITGLLGGATATIEDLLDGWKRISMTTIAATAVASIGWGLYLTSGTATTYNGNGASGLFVWGCQLEKTDVLTGYGIGTAINFTTDFIDIASISVSILTPPTTTARYHILNFLDTPNPVGFKALLYDSSGTRTSGDVSWSAKGY